MGTKWAGNDLVVTIDATTKDEVKRVMFRVVEIADMVLSNAAQDMVETISTTPSSINKKKDNRIDTGLMKNSIDVEDMHVVGKGSYSGSAGWIDLVEDYFLVQEYGGRSQGLRKGDRRITPMHALSKAFYKMQGELENELKHI